MLAAAASLFYRLLRGRLDDAAAAARKADSDASIRRMQQGRRAEGAFVEAAHQRQDVRTYDLFVPDSHGKKPLSLIFVFHGSGGDGAGIPKTFDFERHANGEAIFVYPDGFGGEWDLESKAPSNIDMLMFDAVVETVSNSHCVDTKRVFATGY
jgi:polyhydroxybutyrate depolymerase